MKVEKMFERFKQRYKVTFRLPNSVGAIATNALENTPGYEELMRECAGATFNDGLYRLHTLEDRAKWDLLIAKMFPKRKGRFSTFGYDWMGRHFALDAARQENGQPLVALFDPGFCEELEIPATFQLFHDPVLLEDSDAALLDALFELWLRAGNSGPGPKECVGYKVPLVLGGKDDSENLELTNMEVYWSLQTQIFEQTRDLPPGTPISTIKIS